MLSITSSGKSDIGLKRANNEDSLLERRDLDLFVVADGIGGAASGEVASRIFVETAIEVFSQSGRKSRKEIMKSAQKTFQSANERILHQAKENPSRQGMGCTAELLAFSQEDFVVGHVGDSRTYFLRNGVLKQLTRDHSYIQQQIDLGQITPAEAKEHSYRNVILRAVGINNELEVDFIKSTCRPNDLFLLCSDGLTDLVDDKVIGDTLSLPLPQEQKVDKLIELAKLSGGYDNITVVLCGISDEHTTIATANHTG